MDEGMNERGNLGKALNYRGHIAGLDLLRGAAVLAVVVFHAYWDTLDRTHWRGLAAAWVSVTALGHLGVHLFFVLSGFLITGILLDDKHGPGKARRFYGRRARRILPAYLVVLAVLRLAHVVDWRYVTACLLFIVNMGRLVGAHLTQYVSLWSLAVEEQFYLVWPWVIWRCRPKTVGRVMLLCLVLAPALRLILGMRGRDSYFKTYVNVDYLMYGALIAYALRAGMLHAGNLRRVTGWLYAGAGAGLALWAAAVVFAYDQLWAMALLHSYGRVAEMALFVAMVLSALMAHQAAPVAAPPVSPGGRLASWCGRVGRQGLVWLGYISYGLYLVHLLVFRLYDRYVAGRVLGGYEHSFALLSVRAGLCGAASMLLAWLSRSTLEAWFLRRKVAGPRAPLVVAEMLPPLA